jgi:hypothetical protein
VAGVVPHGGRRHRKSQEATSQVTVCVSTAHCRPLPLRSTSPLQQIHFPLRRMEWGGGVWPAQEGASCGGGVSVDITDKAVGDNVMPSKTSARHLFPCYMLKNK